MWNEKKPILAPNKDSVSAAAAGERGAPLPKLVGPLKPLYSSSFEKLVGPVLITPTLGCTAALAMPKPVPLSPVRSIGPLPVATTLEPTCSSVTT